MASARRPPIHPNCRCTLVPYVELKDEEGNVVDIDNERPAANADFDQLAKDAYNQKAKEKGWKRRFEDLSPSTRLKYYYQAQKDYEKETGKPAYRQVDSNLSFPEYFKQQPDSFKRDWLGAKRYEAYKDGKLTEKAIFASDLGYVKTAQDLFTKDELDPRLLRKVKYFPKADWKHLPDEVKFINTEIEEKIVTEKLKSLGRKIISYSERNIHSSIEERGTPIKGVPNSSVDIYKIDEKGGKKVVRRRFFDNNGSVEQDFDFKHTDTNGTHYFPHIYVWMNGKRFDGIKFR